MQCGYGGYGGYAAPNPYANGCGGYGWAPQVPLVTAWRLALALARSFQLRPSISGPSGCSGYGHGEGFQQGATGTAGMQTGKSGKDGKGDGKSRGKNSKGG